VPTSHVIPPNEPPSFISSELSASLTKSLSHHYGYTDFRPGQLSTISAILSSRDSAVFWATGSGKSLCYQLPALHSGRPAIVISPLISLMQDQCHKLNGQSSKEIATYLGSGQLDPSVEEKVWQGEYLVIYITPEKLGSDGNHYLTSRFAKLNPCVIAVDEAHCVSEWGNDFRPEYRRIGTTLKSSPLRDVPVVALTATASPRVRNDVMASLSMTNPFLSVLSFDRENLEINVRRKTGGYTSLLTPLLKEVAAHNESTIIYAPSKALVNEIAAWIDDNYPSFNVRPYHAGLSQQQRDMGHIDFLTSRSLVVVATIAFGMGIDKSDTRRVIHVGPPKTMEEYYQQIGRGGRDGLPAKCTLFVNESDFDKYGSDFYLGNLKGGTGVRENVERSTQALRVYCRTFDRCRRKMLLDYFEEHVEWEHCGTCDVCRQRSSGKDMDRDFAMAGARLVLMAVKGLNGVGMTDLEKVINGNVSAIKNSWKFAFGFNEQSLKEKIDKERETIKNQVNGKLRPVAFYKELISPLVDRGYIKQIKKSASVQGFNRTWSAYEITPKGQTALNTKSPITLPIPPALHEIEAKEEEKRLKSLEKLKKSGVDLQKVPKKELDQGDGPILSIHKHWLSHMEMLQTRGETKRLEQLQDLKTRIEHWRLDAAQKYQMAPGSVLADHIVIKVAYTSASSHQPIESAALHSVGVRSAGINSLAEVLRTWFEETKKPHDNDNNPSSNPSSSTMVIPSTPLQPLRKWKHATYKVAKSGKLPAWENAYNLFMEGQHPQTIAMTRTPRPIQVATVVGYLFTALEQGRTVPLNRLAPLSAPPTKEEWESFLTSESSSGVDVVEDEKATYKDLLVTQMGEEFMEKEFSDRTEVEKELWAYWCGKLKWFITFRRIGYEPSFN